MMTIVDSIKDINGLDGLRQQVIFYQLTTRAIAIGLGEIRDVLFCLTLTNAPKQYKKENYNYKAIKRQNPPNELETNYPSLSPPVSFYLPLPPFSHVSI